MADELWNSGFPQEMEHFARCVAEDTARKKQARMAARSSRSSTLHTARRAMAVWSFRSS